MNVLITGFTPFGPITTNPSQLIVEEMLNRPQQRGFSLHGHVLETSYDRAGHRIGELLEDLHPEVLLLFGVAQKRKIVTIERIARNLDDCSLPDNAGVIRSGEMILEEGPPAYQSTLPVDDLVRHLNENQIPTEASNDAGTFLCNHTFYRTRHLLEQKQSTTACGFIHVPMPVDLPMEARPEHEIRMEDLVRMCEISIRYLVNNNNHSG